MENKVLPLNLLTTNTGQVDGVPKNPRFIRDDKYGKLKKSIQEDPELLNAMPLIVFPLAGRYVVLAGNMRYRGCKDLGFVDVPCVIVDPQTAPEKLCAYVIKTNISYGEHDFDLLANEWSDLPLSDWGLDIPELDESGADPGDECECSACGKKHKRG